MGKDNILSLSEEMIDFKHSALKYGRVTMAVAMVALILGTVTVVALVVVAIEARNSRSELQTRLDSDMHPQGPDHHGDIMAVKGADDPGTKSRWAGKESHHRSKKSDDGSKLTVQDNGEGHEDQSEDSEEHTGLVPNTASDEGQPQIPVITFKDCQSLYEHGVNTTGFYLIQPDGAPAPFQVCCDFDTEGAWTVIRYYNQDGEVNRETISEPYTDGELGNSMKEMGNFRLGSMFFERLVTPRQEYTLSIRVDDRRVQALNKCVHVRLTSDGYPQNSGYSAVKPVDVLPSKGLSLYPCDDEETIGTDVDLWELYGDDNESDNEQLDTNSKVMMWGNFSIKTLVMKIKPAPKSPS